MALNRPDYAREVRSALVDATRLCEGLGLAKGAKRQASGLMICCPVHGDRDPSCSVTTGKDGTLRAKCFSCDWTADALGIIAVARGLSLRSPGEFREILAVGAGLAGHLSLAAEILDGEPVPDRKPVALPAPLDEREYVPDGEVQEFWNDCGPPADDVEASGYLVRRHLDPELVTARSIARVIGEPLPKWARYRRQSWRETGHRLVVRTFDAEGIIRGVRAIRTRDGDAPKRLPPAGHKASGLCMLNRGAWQMLRGATPQRLVIVEGEPDFMVWATRTDAPVIGVVSGSWTDEFAAAVPGGTDVIIRTHNDEAGDRYADRIVDSLGDKCRFWRKVA